MIKNKRLYKHKVKLLKFIIRQNSFNKVNFSLNHNYSGLSFFIHKSIVYNLKLSLKLRTFIFKYKLFFNGISNIRHRCFLSYKSRNVFSKYNLNQIPFKFKCFNGYINGFYKSTW